MMASNNDHPVHQFRSLHDALYLRAKSNPADTALNFKNEKWSYRELVSLIMNVAKSFSGIGISKNDRIAVILPNCPESVISAYAAFSVGAILVPVNPLLRQTQIKHVLDDCGAKTLVTSSTLFKLMFANCTLPNSLSSVIFIDNPTVRAMSDFQLDLHTWSNFSSSNPDSNTRSEVRSSQSDRALIFYTSGSTGRAKGVLISHGNLADGVRIVSEYLTITEKDNVLAALPLSFDYGFSQITTAFHVGGEVVLTNYSLPQQLLGELDRHDVTGIAGVPTMWSQLAAQSWPPKAVQKLRYITNSGGRLSLSVLGRLRERLPNTQIFLMYGLTEAFRSTYLDPAQLDIRPDSMGRAIPGVSLKVVRSDGSTCLPNEPGELVHSGALVALGYWNNPKATSRRFRQVKRASGHYDQSVWTGDIVTQDTDGYLFFVERADNMLKSSGYRISPTEIEEVAYSSGLADQAFAIGIPDEILGQRIGLAILPNDTHEDVDFTLRRLFAAELPAYMQPDIIVILDDVPLTANRKPDRAAIRELIVRSA